MSEQFKYKTEFDFTVHATNDFQNDLQISSASLESLKPLIPSSVNLEKNIDLLGTAFNAAVVNRFNKNEDGIDSESAAQLIDYFIHKPTNIEHKTDLIVGHIVNAGFSDIESEKLITSKDALGRKDPYYISLSAVVYKTIKKDFAEALLDASDPESKKYQKISASWELGFNDIYIALGSENVKDAEIITDEKQIEEFSKYLSRFGGNGTLDDGTLVRRLIVGDIYPLGIGYTYTPAAEVKGVYVAENDTIDLEKDDADEDKNEIIINIPSKISQNSENNVKRNNDNKNIMNEKELQEQIEKILDSKLSKKAEYSQESVANVSSLVADKIRELNTEFTEKQKALETEKTQAVQEAEKTKASIEKLTTELSEANSKITELQDSIASREAEELFNSRMSVVDKDFDLSDEDRSFVAKEVKSLDSTEASFESYQSKLNSLLQHKSKAFIEKQEEEINSRIEKAVAEKLKSLDKEGSKETKEDKAKESEVAKASAEDLEEALDKTEASTKEPISNNTGNLSKEDLKTKFQNAFKKENIEITN